VGKVSISSHLEIDMDFDTDHSRSSSSNDDHIFLLELCHFLKRRVKPLSLIDSEYKAERTRKINKNSKTMNFNDALMMS
jgi:hypothetical protein